VCVCVCVCRFARGGELALINHITNAIPYSAQNTTIPAHGRALVDTDISIAVPAGTYGRIAPRSGLAVKNFIDVGAGVIDADYRGQVKILLFNHADSDFEVKEGDRVAQLILERVSFVWHEYSYPDITLDSSANFFSFFPPLRRSIHQKSSLYKNSRYQLEVLGDLEALVATPLFSSIFQT